MINKDIYKNISVIYNSHSGSFSRAKISKFIGFLKLNGFSVEAFSVKNEADSCAILDLLDFRQQRLIIIASGDGTINGVINHLYGNKFLNNIVLAILPMGTANILAMELNTETVGKLKNSVFNGEIIPVHIGKITNLDDNKSRFFSIMASIGFDSSAIKNIKYYKKFIVGKFSYIAAYVLKFFFGRTYRFKTTANGKEYENCFSCVSNGKFYGIKKSFTTADITVNSFDVVVAKKLKFFRF